MKIIYNWYSPVILTLPIAWVLAFLLYLRPILLSSSFFVLPSISVLVLGLIMGGLLADKVKSSSNILIGLEIILLLFGIVQFFVPFEFWMTLFGIISLFVMFLFFGSSLSVMTLFLNQMVSGNRRGHVAGMVTVIAFIVCGILSIIWREFPTPFAPAITAALIFIILIAGYFVRPWRKELQTFMVPGSITPYIIWWAIYLLAFALYVWATPTNLFQLFQFFIFYGFRDYRAELVLVGIGGVTTLFIFLPDRLGRKRMFSIASVLLGLICIFGMTLTETAFSGFISLFLFAMELVVISFIISAGAWLIWAEVGSVRFKGRRAAFGWSLVVITGGIIWYIVSTGNFISESLFVAISATLVLFSVFPLTNATEVLWNERTVEDIDISVDTRQVSRALRDLEIDTSLKSIEEQIGSEIDQLAQIQGISRGQAKQLRDAGFETPDLVARANIDLIAQILQLAPEKAIQIIENAKKIQIKKSDSGLKISSNRGSKRTSSKSKASKK